MSELFLRFPSGDIAHVRSADDARCWEYSCNKFSEFTCDFPRCGRHICPNHVSHGFTPGIQFCREHYPLALAAHRRRTARNKTVLYDRKTGRVIGT